jgi:hypothetical protein
MVYLIGFIFVLFWALFALSWLQSTYHLSLADYLGPLAIAGVLGAFYHWYDWIFDLEWVFPWDDPNAD